MPCCADWQGACSVMRHACGEATHRLALAIVNEWLSEHRRGLRQRPRSGCIRRLCGGRTLPAIGGSARKAGSRAPCGLRRRCDQPLRAPVCRAADHQRRTKLLRGHQDGCVCVRHAGDLVLRGRLRRQLPGHAQRGVLGVPRLPAGRSLPSTSGTHTNPVCSATTCCRVATYRKHALRTPPSGLPRSPSTRQHAPERDLLAILQALSYLLTHPH